MKNQAKACDDFYFNIDNYLIYKYIKQTEIKV